MVAASWKATGARSTVVAELEITWLAAEVSRIRPPSISSGPPPPSQPSNPWTMKAIPPVFSRAVAMGRIAAMRTTLSQFTDR
jgi:hypothetical protein